MRPWLEPELEPELHRAFPAATDNASEIGIAHGSDRESWIEVIEGAVGLGSELEIDPFSKLELLQQSQVSPDGAWTIEQRSSRVSESRLPAS